MLQTKTVATEALDKLAYLAGIKMHLLMISI